MWFFVTKLIFYYIIIVKNKKSLRNKIKKRENESHKTIDNSKEISKLYLNINDGDGHEKLNREKLAKKDRVENK